ncbi:MAG: S26 family signal peptidase [Acidimicrobiia bacterium]|nr:S26 family signal peptidase [Acidimicrobiia bacterium]
MNMTMFRFRVAQNSMEPNLSPGDEFVATNSRPARRGEIVATPHPHRDDFWLVKRLTGLAGERVSTDVTIPERKAWVLSDSSRTDSVDSRTFGPVDFDTLHPVVTQLDEVTFAEGVDLLTAEDDRLRTVVEQFSTPLFWHRPPGFATLVLLILEQQVSLESGAAVFGRLVAATGAVTPENIQGFGEQALNAIGLTRQKAGYVTGLARDVITGRIDLEAIGAMPDDLALAMLESVKGIGPWTAQAYLLSAERRPDLFPIGDRALQVGTGEALELSSPPTGEDLEMLAEPWRPIRSVAARILWHGYLARRGRVEPQHPLSVQERPETA